VLLEMQRGGGYRRREPLALEETQEKFIAAAAGLGVSRDLWWSVECLLWRCGVGHRRWMLMFTGEITASINEWNEGVIKEARRQQRNLASRTGGILRSSEFVDYLS